MEEETLNYYNQNTKKFIANTRDEDMSASIQRFLSYLQPRVYILDLGCGSGRDTKYFLDKGFLVDAMDGSEELCKEASIFTGMEVKQMNFLQLDETQKYDGIWACASILHLSTTDLITALEKIEKALKSEGVLYTSFKYGTFEGIRCGRYFTDMTEDRIQIILDNIDLFSIEQEWVSEDIRPGREGEKWLNLIIKKKC